MEQFNRIGNQEFINQGAQSGVKEEIPLLPGTRAMYRTKGSRLFDEVGGFNVGELASWRRDASERACTATAIVDKVFLHSLPVPE